MKTDDIREFSRQTKLLVMEYKQLEAEQPTTSVISERFDYIIRRKNEIRIKLKALQIRLDNLGKLSGYALPDDFNEIPKF